MKMKITLIALVLSLACISFSFQSEMDILTLKTVKIDEPNLQLRPFISNEEQHDNNSSNEVKERILTEESKEENDKTSYKGENNTKYLPKNSKYKIDLTDEDIQSYLNITDLKSAFENDFEYLPRYFTFDKEYLESYKKFSIFFGSVALSFFGAIAVFFLIRFLFNRFRPTKVIRIRTQSVNKQFKNITWVLFVIGSIGFIVCYTIVLDNTFKINEGARLSFEFAKEKSEKIATKYLLDLETFKNKSSDLQLNSNSEDLESTFTILAGGLQDYQAKTDSNIDVFLDIEEKKNMFSVIFFIFYILIILVVVALIIKKYKEPVIYISNIVLLTVPILIVLSGMVSIYFFIYTDFCYSVHTAIYEDNFPIYNKGIGKIVSCFNSTTKSAIYQLTNEFKQIAEDVQERLKNSSATDHRSLLEADYLYKNNVTNAMNSLIGCDHVYEILPTIQANSCNKGHKWVTMIEMYLLLIVFVFIIGVSFKRFALYIQKKIDERKDMEQNLLFQ